MQCSSSAPVALLGGTFDPIHRGHIEPALTLADRFAWQQVHLQPCFAPPHRPAPQASDAQRLHMVELACQVDPRLVADDFELRRGQPTRTVHTLNHLRAQHPDSALCFILGMDSFINFTGWLDWPNILKLAHLMVLPRPGYQLTQATAPLLTELKQRQRQQVADFAHGSGHIYIADTPPIDISATELRTQLANAVECPELLYPQVFQYIREQGLYR